MLGLGVTEIIVIIFLIFGPLLIITKTKSRGSKYDETVKSAKQSPEEIKKVSAPKKNPGLKEIFQGLAIILVSSWYKTNGPNPYWRDFSSFFETVGIGLSVIGVFILIGSLITKKQINKP